MKRRRIHFSAGVSLRLLAIALLAAVPVACCIACAVGLAKGHYVRVFGGDLVRETQGTYVVRYDEISFSYSTGWAGIPPQKGRLLTLPGIDVIRAVAELTDEDAGAVILIIRVRWWLLLLANAAPILLAYLLARPMLRRRHVPGHCRACGYDLRASTGRCPECGTEIPESAQIDKQ